MTATQNPNPVIQSRGPAKQTRSPKVLRRVPLTIWIAGTFALFLLIASVAPQLLATTDPNAIELASPLAPPSWEHWFGTDQSGRDL